MNRKLILLISCFLIISLVLVGSVFAQSPSGLSDPIDNDDLESAQVCSGEKIHPVLSILADLYSVEYEDLLVYFCEYEFGVGQIKLALVTAQHEDVNETFEELLAWRYGEGEKEIGWGQIWQELGLIGRGRQSKEKNTGDDPQNNKPALPPGLGGDHPGKGHGLKK